MSVYVKGGIVAIVVLVGVFFYYQYRSPDLPVNQSPAGFAILDKMEKEGVPDFTLERLDGSTLQLSQFKGKVVIVNFWASWCNPCVQEFPSMMKLVEEFKGDVVVVAVSTDDNKKDIENFTKAFGLPKPGFEVVWDKDKKVMETYGVGKIPESFLAGKDFKLTRKVLGIEDWASPGAFDFFRSLTGGNKPGPASAH